MPVPWSLRVSPGGGPGVLSSRAPALARVPAPPRPRRHFLLSDCRPAPGGPAARSGLWSEFPPTSAPAPQASGDNPGSGRSAPAPGPASQEDHTGPSSAKRDLPRLTKCRAFWIPNATLHEGTVHGELLSFDPLTPGQRPNAQRSGRLGGFTLTFFICVF